MSLLPTLLVGFVTGVGLIVAIGPQNAYILRQGVRREGVAVVVAVCALADILLIALGTAGIGIVFDRAPWIIVLMRWGGVLYLLRFAHLSLRSAFGEASSLQLSPGGEAGGATGGAAGGEAGNGAGAVKTRGAGAIALATAGLTFLNPHVYLDTVVMLGTVANQQDQRWVFAAGAMLGSVVWFAGLGWGAHLLAPVLRSPRVWRAIDVGIAVVMVLVAAKLAFAV